MVSRSRRQLRLEQERWDQETDRLARAVVAAKGLACPACGGAMVPRRGRHGSFFGCADWPTCRGTRNG